MCPTGSSQKPPNRVACAGAVVHDGEGRLLLVQRAHEPSQGLWSLPGGRVEAGESPQAAVVREVREETGLAVTVGDAVCRIQIGDYEGDDYAVTVVGGELRAGDDAADVRWVDMPTLTAMDARGELSAGLLAELRRAGVVG